MHQFLFRDDEPDRWCQHDQAEAMHIEPEKNGEAQYVTVLELPPVDSAETAVKTAIAAEVASHGESL